MALRCLIVDDHAPFLEVASDLLERQGVSVVGVASTGEEALERARELQPDVTLVDIDLGEESGFDLAQRIAGATGLGGVRLVLVSAHSESDFADLIAASPAVGFLNKSDLSASAIHGLLDGAPGDGSRPT